MNKKLLITVGFILVALASPSLWAAQFARPDGTVTASGWSAVNAATLHDAINETVADDSNYIDTGVGNSSTVIFSLSNVSDPGTYASNHIIRWRCQATVGAKPKGGETCDAALYQGNTLIEGSNNNSATRGAFGLMTYTITNASTITDYSALELRITSSMDADESIQVSWAEVEVPGAAATPPTVTSPTFADVTDTTATLGGNVTDNGGASVTARGVEWGTSPGSYPNSVPEGGGGTGVFTVPVTGLPSSSTIYFRAWATNAGGTGYTAESSFTTSAPASPPTVDTP
ncbi:MAG: hypothetical protein HUJ31_09270, partial [Pseudomonadales bacterium]|nr:hypothetical protein [Pseudomonadales bacterium]